MMRAIFLSLFSLVFMCSHAEAGCRSNKPICGNPNICHSDERSSNRHDLDQELHPILCKVLNNMENQFGKLGILAAYRADNASRGGAKDSMHLYKNGGPTMGVDIRVRSGAVGKNRKQMYGFLGTQKCMGIRYNIYCGTGTVHVDVSKRKDNYSGCPDFYRTKCGDGSNPGNSGQVFKSAVVQNFNQQPHPVRRQCWNAKKWGTCCGPKRKANGWCTG